MPQYNTRQAALENAKREVIVAGARLYRAKIKHLKAQDGAHQIKRNEMTQFISRCEHSSGPDVPLNAEQSAYNRKLLRRFYGTEENWDRQRMYLRFELRTEYLNCLLESKRRLEKFNQAGFLLRDLQPKHFFMSVRQFNRNYEAAFNEDNLQAEHAEFVRAVERMNTLNHHYARWVAYAANLNADGYCFLLLTQLHCLLQWSFGSEELVLPMLWLLMGVNCVQLGLLITYCRNQARIMNYMHQSIPTVFSNTELKTLFSTRNQSTETTIAIRSESPSLR